MLESLQALDRTVFLALNGMHTPYWDSFMYIFTSKLVWIPLYVSILYVLYKHEHPNGHIYNPHVCSPYRISRSDV